MLRGLDIVDPIAQLIDDPDTKEHGTDKNDEEYRANDPAFTVHSIAIVLSCHTSLPLKASSRSSAWSSIG